MAKTTLLRVKRRRDEAPPPSTIQVTIDAIEGGAGGMADVVSKRVRKSTVVNQLSHLMSETTLLPHPPTINTAAIGSLASNIHQESNGNSPPTIKQQRKVIFRKVTNMHPPTTKHPSHESRKRKPHPLLENDSTPHHTSSSSFTNQEYNVIDATFAFDATTSNTTTSSNLNVTHNQLPQSNPLDVLDHTRPQPYQHEQKSQQQQPQQQQQKEEYFSLPAPPPTKRKKISLQMVQSQIMTEQEFWKNHYNTTYMNTYTNTSADGTTTSRAGDINNIYTTSKTTKSTSSVQNPPKQSSQISSQKATSSIGKRTTLPQKKKKTNLILDPITQTINQSLLLLHPCNQDAVTISADSAINNGIAAADTSMTITAIDATQKIMSHIHTIQTHGLSNLRKYINWKSVTPSLPTNNSKILSSTPSMNISTSTNNEIISNGSTILHMTSILNSTSAADYICRNYSGIIDFNLVDDDGYTARDVAEVTGSDGVARILSSYMKDNASHSRKQMLWDDRMINDNNDDNNQTLNNDDNDNHHLEENRGSIRDVNVVEKREEDYVYDVYCLKQTTPDDSEKEVDSRVDDESIGNKATGCTSFTSSESWVENNNNTSNGGGLEENGERDKMFKFDSIDDTSTNSCSDPVMVLKGGYGFWNEHGELILEVAPTGLETCSDIDDNDDEHDSNCEDYEGNDYPDDFSLNDSDEYGSYHGSSDFRHRAVDYGTNVHYGLHQYGDDDDDIGDEEYAGYMNTDSSHWSHERIYGETEAYDPDFDEEY